MKSVFSRLCQLFSWKITPIKLIFLVALYFTVAFNIPFYRAVFQNYQPIGAFGDYFVYTVPLVLLVLCNIIFNVLTLPFVHKIIVPIFILFGAAVSYNSLFFNIYFNREMLDNVLQTHAAEALGMMSVSYVLWLVFLGIVPAILYVRCRLQYAVWWREILKRLASIAASLVVVLAIAALFYQDYATFFRNHNNMKYLIVPSNFVGSSISKIKQIRKANMPYDAWAKGSKLAKPNAVRHVSVLVVGETTRSQNWGLNGYAKSTTPKMAQRMANGEAMVNFSNVSSCGTSTAVSVPCMFSPVTQADYGDIKIQKQDNVLDALQYAGIGVHWLENNSDCKGACKNVPTVRTIDFKLPEMCRSGLCLDNIMLPELDKILANAPANQDLAIVVHTIGSHGPTYYERYTDKERVFTPTCDTREINRCSKEELDNTYDNTIVYVDQLLDQIITRLQQHEDWASSMFYLSDHGESLGENGVYLHGMPYAIAPKEQTSVPMLMWFSNTWLANKNVDLACLKDKAKTQTYSHDNFFHTIFSLFDMQTNSVAKYQQEMDILAQCRK
ncbi:MAG: phosphoethanolamine--lipid A transferase [Neisseria sp.]|nr:phosphoethanolamine--lipid A transferase [Neisseria sp.]